MKWVRTILITLLLATALSSLSFADNFCVQGSLSDVLGTTCTIGSLTFNFGATKSGDSGYSSLSTVFDLTTNSYVSFNSGVSSSQIIFAPVIQNNYAGFQLSNVGISTTGTDNNLASSDYLGVILGVSATSGEAVIGSLQASLGSGSTAKGSDWAYAVADMYGCQYGFNSCPGSAQWVYSGAVDGYLSTFAPVRDFSYYGTVELYTLVRNGTATVDSGTFLYATVPVPEPGSMVLLATGLLGAAGAMRRKLLVK